MEDRILKLIAALRSSGVRVSLAESAEAFSAVDLMGVTNRQDFWFSLRSTLVKNGRDLPLFDKLFPLFFGAAQPPKNKEDLFDALTPGEAQLMEDALRELTDRLRQSLERLIRGRSLSKKELEQLAKLTGLNRIEDLRFQNWMSDRMQRAAGIPELRELLSQLMEKLMQEGFDLESLENLQGEIESRLQAMMQQIAQFTGERIAENLSLQKPGEPISDLMNRPFGSLSEEEKRQIMLEVKRLATALRTRVALRQKRAKSGRLDAKTTIRANLKYQGVPMVIHHRDHVRKPKIVILCDVSTSMRFCSELMLSFIYELQEQVRKMYAFAFIDHLEYISGEFTRCDGNAAIASILRKMPSGSYNTDLGWALHNFNDDFLDIIDGHTTLIVVGDGRNNYNDPRADIFKVLARRASRTLWLTPESSEQWGTGDSDMPVYANLCDSVFKVSNLSELSVAVNEMMGA